MSPRSAEFIEAAERRLKLAQRAIDDDPGGALSAGYYAMLYAARAALSERDTYAKTHAGTWHQFREQFVATGIFDRDLVSSAQDAQREREEADYEAWAAPREKAEQVIELAGRFVEAVQRLLDTS